MINNFPISLLYKCARRDNLNQILYGWFGWDTRKTLKSRCKDCSRGCLRKSSGDTRR